MLKIKNAPEPKVGLTITHDELERKVMAIPPGKEVLCPNCSHARKPEHRKRPCFKVWVNEKSKGFKCQNCGIAGFVHEGQDMKPSYKPAPLRSNIPDYVVEYFRGRKILESTLMALKITGVNGNIAFPYFDESMNQVGVKFRDNSPEGHGNKRYWKQEGSKSLLYGIHAIPPDAHRSTQDLVIVEGEPDTAAGREAGIWSIVGLPDGVSKDGKQGKKLDVPLRECADFLSKYDFYVLALDGDPASKAAIEELADRLGRHRCKFVTYPPGCKDMNQVLIKYGREACVKMVKEAELFPMEGVVELEDEHDLIEQVMREGFPTVPPTGLSRKFDAIIKYIRSQINLTTGVPNHGKTHFILQVMLYLSVSRGWKWAVFSPEQDMPDEINGKKLPKRILLVQALVEALVGLPMFEDKYCTDEHGNYIKIEKMGLEVFRLATKFIYAHFKIVEAGPVNTLPKILEKVDYLKIKHNIDGFMIDPWNKVSGTLNQDNAQLAKTLIKLDNFCKSRQQCLFLNAHPVKNLGSKEVLNNSGKLITISSVPRPSDVKGGGEFYDMVPNIGTVYRDFSDNSVSFFSWKIKHRILGTPGQEVKFQFNTVNGRYEDWESPHRFNPLIDLAIEQSTISF